MTSAHDSKFGLVRGGNTARPGQWSEKPQPAAEQSVEAALNNQPLLSFEDGDGDYFTTGDDGPVDRIHVSRNDIDAPNTYNIDVEQYIDFRSLVPDSVGTDDEKDEWLRARLAILEDFFRTRYDAELDGGSDQWDQVNVSMRATHQGAVSETQAFELGWEQTKAVALYNEYDRGTYGSEYLGTLLASEFERFSIAGVQRGAPDRDRRSVIAEVELRVGEREISDEGAVAVAGLLLAEAEGAAGLGHLQNLATFGYAEKVGLRDDLHEVYRSQYGWKKTALDMLGTWNHNGGDND